MLPPGFLGTDADLLIDTIIVALPLVLLAMGLAVRAARGGRWSRHRTIQTGLFAVLAVVVGALELDLQALGGIGGMLPPERSVSASARTLLRVHLAFSTSTAVVWTALVAASWWRFPRPPRPSSFSRFHRTWGRIGVGLMVGTVLTGGLFYALLFVA